MHALGPLTPPPRDNQRLTVRFLHASLDVEHDGDVVTIYDSAHRHPGMRNRIGLWIAMMLGGMGVVCVLLLIDLQPATLAGNLELGGGAVVLLGLAGFFFLMARLPNERRLIVDLGSGSVELRWQDAELARWRGDVDGLRFYICPMRPQGSILFSPCFASVAVLHGTRTPPDQIDFEHGPLTRAILHIHMVTAARSVNRYRTDRGWMLMATGEDPNALDAELREAMPTLTSVIEPQRIDDALTGTVVAKLLRKPTPRKH